MAIDLASVATSDSAASYHLSMRHNSGSTEQLESDQEGSSGVPPPLLPGVSFQSAYSYRQNINIWKSGAPKLKLVQLYALFLSDPHASASGIIGATCILQDLLNSQKPNMDAVQAICPHSTFSLQQQILGLVSFRVDSGVTVDLINPDWRVQVHEPIFAIEFALQVPGSTKAVAWYSPMHQEFMTELRFFETSSIAIL